MKKKWCCLVVFCLMFAATGCTSTPVDKTGFKKKEAMSDAHYPVTISNYNFGKEAVEIVFEKAPEKVFAVYQNSIETLLALGLEDRIVAAAGLDHEVKEEYKTAFGKVNYLTELMPTKENVTVLEPDFILSWISYFADDRIGDVSEWNQKGVNTYISLNSGAAKVRTLENEYQDILNLGKIFNVEEKAETIVNEMKTAVKNTQKCKEKETIKPKTMVIAKMKESITNYGSTTLAGDMITQLGATLANPDAKKIGAEDLVNINPDVIFVVYMDREGENMAKPSVENIVKDPVYASLDAVKNNRVIPIQLGEMYCSGTRTIDGLTVFAKGLYPELGLE